MSDAVLKYGEPENYVNRELSWLEFNYRILGEARDKTTPLFERLKFLSITASNLDEFFMVRVASLKDMVHANYTKRDIAGMTAQEQLDAIDGKTHELVENQYRTYNRMLLPLLKQHGLRVVTEHEKLTKEEAVYVDRYFEESVYPVLTPMAVDSSRPFPLIHNKSLNIAALVRKKKGDGELEFAMVCVPGGLPRVVALPCQEGKSIIYLEEVIERNIDKLFLNYDIISCHPFRVMRNADLSIDEDEAEDLLKEIEQKLKKRQWGEVIRLDIEKKADKRLLDILKKELHVGGHAIYEIDGPLDLTVLMKVFGLPGFDEFKTPPYTPQPVPALMNEDDIFANIRKGDILLTHPFETFEPVVNFIKKAARDPEVLAIKQTLYRTSSNSPIIDALIDAAHAGKQVLALVEIKARFDEDANIAWARKLERAGVHVVYGIVGLKTHCKLIEVVRIGKQLLMTRGSLTPFSVANDMAKYFAIIPALFSPIYPGLGALNILGLASPLSAVLSAIIYNALVIVALIPAALKGVKYREVPSGQLLTHNLLVWGLGGIVAPFVCIKLIDMLLAFGGIM